MKKEELADYTVYITTEYYKNNIQPFLNAFSENCIWIGPAEGQIIHSKKALLDTFSREDNQLTFAIQDIQVIPIAVNRTSHTIILTYTVISYYPDGKTTVFHQRAEMLWILENRTNADGEPCKDFGIRVCHISNEFPYDTKDTIYPNHFTELSIAQLYTGKPKLSKAPLKGIHGSSYYLSGSSIMWVENKEPHTFLHTTDKVFESLESLSDIVDKYPDSLCRIHASYAVNPAYVETIGRFYVIMDDGTKINIPEKKYTKTRDMLHHKIEQLKKNL